MSSHETVVGWDPYGSQTRADLYRNQQRVSRPLLLAPEAWSERRPPRPAAPEPARAGRSSSRRLRRAQA